ncbi:MAG: fasciclin domain-containing protein [Ilumatobacteraceae bacterium]
MKKLLIGLAAGALAVTATGAAQVSAAPPTVYEILTGSVGSSYAELLIDSSGLDAALDDCGNTGNNNGLPNYTVFFPAADAVFEAVLDELGLSLGQVLAQPALVKTVLLYHVVKQDITPEQLVDNSNTKFNTMGGLTLIKTAQPAGPPNTNFYLINGYSVVGVAGDTDGYLLSDGGAQQACNGWVYLIAGFLAPNSAIATVGLTADGSATQAAGEGLPKTGSESMALTYAALASLIAGAGVLVLRRRSVA